jgi:hypothetical protein
MFDFSFSDFQIFVYMCMVKVIDDKSSVTMIPGFDRDFDGLIVSFAFMLDLQCGEMFKFLMILKLLMGDVIMPQVVRQR